MITRWYQKEAANTSLSQDNGIVVLPTGSGKSIVIAEVVKPTKEKVLVLQPTKEILESNLQRVLASGLEVSVFSASVKRREVGHCTYATIGSIIRELDRFLDVHTLIIDECHLVNPKGGLYEQLIGILKPKRLLGLTATPYRLHTTSLGSDVRILTRTRPKLFENIIYKVDSPDLIKEGYLLQPQFIVSGYDQNGILRLNSTGSDFDSQAIERYIVRTDVVARAFTAIKDALSKGAHHILVFMPFLPYSETLLQMLSAENISAAIVKGEDTIKKRELTLSNFQNGIIPVVINVGVLTTGYDFPALDCIVCARPTQSLGLYYQIIGRCVRPFLNKEPVVYDLVDNFSRFGDPTQYRLVESSSKMWALLNIKGRLTNRIIGQPPEMLDTAGFGKYAQTPLHAIPTNYLTWYVTNCNKNAVWHTLKFELLRREIFN